MRIFTAFIAIIHGLIHLMGFLKAYQLTELSKYSINISRFQGIFWLLSGILFIASGLFTLLKFAWWPFVVITAIVISQILIIIDWPDAKFGTILNVLLLIISLPVLGTYNFDRHTTTRINEINKTTSLSEKIEKESHLENLPPIVQKWLIHSGVAEQEKVHLVQLFQKGKMRTKSDGKWMPFTAEEYFNADENSFIWTAEVKMIPGIILYGRDQLKNGKASMLIKLMGLFPVVDEEDNFKVNTGAMIRYLGEICWFPSAALNSQIKWKELDHNAAEAILQQNDLEVSGIFHFSEAGELLSFEAERYYGTGKDSKMEKWLVETQETKDFYGILVPSKSNVIWKLPGGDFHWLSLEITDIQYL